ncbi:hypothetical protein ACFWA6_29740 [Streptomyces sp. NPDC060020]|uniref:hypothetical protein n=1 Tax=Streptomyces sp. NPDC060020 TaxID=3347038 RepID=UPI00369199AB
MPLSTDRRTRRTGSPRATLAALCLTALLCGGCGAGQTAAHRTSNSAQQTSTSPSGTSIEEIAAAIGCTAEVSVEADELRQGGCQTEQGGPYRMVTFAAEQGLRSWLTEAKMYGGLYLVGDRWVVTAGTEDALAGARGRLGGALEKGDTHAGPSEHPGSSEHAGSPEHAGSSEHPEPSGHAEHSTHP